jgi:chromosome segregation ATPase
LIAQKRRDRKELATELEEAKSQLKAAEEKLGSGISETSRTFTNQTKIFDDMTKKISKLNQQDEEMKEDIRIFEEGLSGDADTKFQDAKGEIEAQREDLTGLTNSLERLAKDRTRLEVAFFEAALEDPETASEEEKQAETAALNALNNLENTI